MRRIVGLTTAATLMAGNLIAGGSVQAAVAPRAIDGCANPAAVRVATGLELRNAFTAAVDGTVICITADLRLFPDGARPGPGPEVRDRSVTLDGGGHTITMDPSGEGLYFDMRAATPSLTTIANIEFLNPFMRDGNSVLRFWGNQTTSDDVVVSNVTVTGARQSEVAAGVIFEGLALRADEMGRVGIDYLYVADTLAQTTAPVAISANSVTMENSSFHRNQAVHDAQDLSSLSRCERDVDGYLFSKPRAGAASLQAASIEISNSIFWSNSADCGGALFLTQPFYARDADAEVTINGSSIAYNASRALGGGGIHAERLASLTVLATGVLANDAKRTGGGIDATDVDAVVVKRSGVSFNSTEIGDGGGVNAFSTNPNSSLTLDTSIMRGNSAGFSGGGIAADVGLTAILASRLSDNAALEGDGGGVYALEPDEAAAEAYRIQLDGATLSSNRAPLGEGGGIRAITTSPTRVVNSTIADNSAQLAGGLDVPIGPLAMEFATVTGNTATNGQGAGISIGRGLAAGADVASSVTNSIVWGNTGNSAQDVWVSVGAIARTRVAHVVHTSANSVNVPLAAGNIVGDPLLTMLGNNGGPSPDPGSPMLTRAPLVGSPALGAGERTTVAVDQVGNARSLAAPTIGAVERAARVPSAPLGLAAQAGEGSVQLTWQAPQSDGGSPLRGYLVEQSADGGRTWQEVAASPASQPSVLIINLINGRTYAFRVTAINEVGPSPASAETTATPILRPPLAPGRPTGIPGDNAIELSWAPPANAESSAIIGYRIDRSTDGGVTWDTRSPNTGSAAVQATDLGVSNGTAYVYRVFAINAAGLSEASATSAPITPSAALPSAPGRPAGEPGDAQVRIIWAAPVSEGDRPVTGYAIEATTDGLVWTTVIANTGSVQRVATIPGLVNGTNYAFRVSAISAAGQGPASAASPGYVPESPLVPPLIPPAPPAPGPDPVPAPPEPALPAPGPVPGPEIQPQPALPGAFASAPRDVIATAGNASASVRWTAPATSGTYPVTRYWVTANPGGAGCLAVTPALTCKVAGLVNGTTYTFTVEALTSAGWSAPSAPSNAITPEDSGSIEITGKRTKVRGKKGLVVNGTSEGIAAGAILRPWLKFPGQTEYFQGVARIKVRADGTFTWQRKGNKRTYVYVATEDGSIRSDRIIIEPAPKGR